jgi:predicted dehydrogenase
VKNRVGIGIIGTGFARKVQIPAFMACDGAAIASVSSGSLENAKSTAEEFSVGHFSSDWRETVKHPDVDLVCITTPPNLHREMTLFAIEHGKHILCEKPMAMNVAEAEEMRDAAAGKPILALIDHELRFQPGRQIARDMIREGAIGKIRHAKAIFQAPHRGDASLPWNWWSDLGAGGGALGAIGSHVIDSFNWFLGSGIETVSCQLHSHIKERRDAHGEMKAVTTDDEANMLLRFADGPSVWDATGLVSMSMLEIPKYQNRMEFYGTEGALRIDHRGDVYLARPGKDSWDALDVELAPPIPNYADTGFTRGFVVFAQAIMEALSLGRTEIDDAATFEDGVAVQRVLDAARESNELRRGVLILGRSGNGAAR